MKVKLLFLTVVLMLLAALLIPLRADPQNQSSSTPGQTGDDVVIGTEGAGTISSRLARGMTSFRAVQVTIRYVAARVTTI